MPDQDWADYLKTRGGTSQAPPQQAPAASGDDEWDKAIARYKTGSNGKTATASPSPQLASDNHGLPYKVADTLLNGNPVAGIPGDPNGFLSVAQGVGKEALSFGAGLGSIYNKFTGSKQDFNQDNLKDLTESKNIGQSIGKFGTQLGEFALAPEVKGLGTVANLGSKAIGSGLIAGVQSGGDPLSTAVGAVAPLVLSSPVARGLGKAISEGLGLTSRASQQVVQRAFEKPNSSDLLKAASGDISVEDVAKNVISSVENLHDKAASDYVKAFNDKVVNGNVPDWTQKSQKVVSDLNNKLQTRLADFGIKEKVNSAGKTVLDFSQASEEPGFQDGVKKIWRSVRQWDQDPDRMTPVGLHRLKAEKIGSFAGEDGKLGAFAKSMYDSAKDGLNGAIDGYGEMSAKYAESKKSLDQVKSALSARANGNSNEHAVVSKLQYLFNQPTDYRQSIIKQLPNGEQLLDQVAGLHLKDIMPRGLMKIVMGGEGLAAIAHPASIPALVGAAAVSSPRLVGIGARAAGRIAANPGVQGIAKFAPKVVPAVVDDLKQ